MRAPVSSLAVALAVACLAVGCLGDAWGDEAEGLEPTAALNAAPIDGHVGQAAADPERAAVAPQAISAATSANPLWEVPIGALPATRERPIFSASRRPPPQGAAPVMVMRAAPPPPPPEPERPNLQLVGTVIGDEESFGIFVDPSSQLPLRLRIGAAHEGWRLEALKPREAVLRKDGETVILPMPQLGQSADDDSDPVPAPPSARARMARRSR